MGSIWLDLVRYSEYMLKRTPEGQVPVTTLFMLYKHNAITHIFAARTERIIEALKLSPHTAEDLLRINEELPRAFNAQARLTAKDISKFAEFHVR